MSSSIPASVRARARGALAGLVLGGLAAVAGSLPAAAQDTAQDVIGRNKLVTNPQIRRDLHFQRSPGLRARSFKESGGFVERGARPDVGRLADVPRRGFAAAPPPRQRGTDDPALPGVEPTPEQVERQRGIFDGVTFPRPETGSWLERAARPRSAE